MPLLSLVTKFPYDPLNGAIRARKKKKNTQNSAIVTMLNQSLKEIVFFFYFCHDFTDARLIIKTSINS